MKKKISAPARVRENQSLPARAGPPSDGYHELRTIFQTISLHDTLELSIASQARNFTGDEMPPACRNREPRISGPRRVGREIGFRGGIRARIEKRIPVARGLGGGSSDAAAALIGMLRLTKKSCRSRVDGNCGGLGRRCAVSFFFGGRALAVNRGDEIYPLEMPEAAISL